MKLDAIQQFDTAQYILQSDDQKMSHAKIEFPKNLNCGWNIVREMGHCHAVYTVEENNPLSLCVDHISCNITMARLIFTAKCYDKIYECNDGITSLMTNYI